MRKTFVNPVADGAVVVQRRKDLFHFVQHVFDAHHVEECFLLTSKRCIWQVFSCGGRTNRKGSLCIASTQDSKLRTNGFFQICRKWLSFDHGSDFQAHAGQRTDVLNIQGIQFLIDAIDQAVVLQKCAKGISGGGEACWHANTVGQLRNHLTQAGVFAANRLDVVHSKLLKGNDQSVLCKKVRHKSSKVKKRVARPEPTLRILLVFRFDS